MNDFLEIFTQIQQRPTLYLSRKSIFDFQSFYYGYTLAKQQFNLQTTENDRKFEDFLSWIRNRYDLETTQSWASLILFHSLDETDALERLFKLWEEYKKLNNEELIVEQNNFVIKTT